MSDVKFRDFDIMGIIRLQPDEIIGIEKLDRILDEVIYMDEDRYEDVSARKSVGSEQPDDADRIL